MNTTQNDLTSTSPLNSPALEQPEQTVQELHKHLSQAEPETSVGHKEPFSIFSKSEKWLIVSLVALAGLFSPLTANIYFPALPALARSFNKSLELINLTVTIYMVFQGISPMVWGPLADRRGRRPVYIACLLTLALSCVGLALVPTSAYWPLMLLRCFQAAGSASTIALGAGVIGDISTREERAGFFGVFTVGPMIGPAIGPVLGGVIADHLGWRAIFWFLTICSSLCCIVVLCFLPETLRTLVGNGSIVPSRLYRPFIPLLSRRVQALDLRSSAQLPAKKVGNPFRLFMEIDILLLLGMNAILNSVLYGALAILSTAFEVTYPFLTESTIGVSFLAVGGGMIVGSVGNGRILDREYQTFKRKLGGVESRDVFPIEKARLRLLPFLMVVLAACNAGYGWSLQTKTNIAVPLILQFIVGFGTIIGMNSTSTLMIDLFPGQSSSITACNNLVRCTVAAGLVSALQPMIDGIGYGWTYVILAGVTLLSIPLLYIDMHAGPKYRLRRYKRSLGNSATDSGN